MAAALLRSAELGALRQISDTLQHAMLDLASDLPTVAARYIPKTSNLTVGGDWYEVIDLGEGRRALIVGDCVGHGLEAATAMGALRNVEPGVAQRRARAGRSHQVAARFRDDDARRVLRDRRVRRSSISCEQTITYSNAGHPPPLLVHDDNAVWLDEALATPLAVGDPTRDRSPCPTCDPATCSCCTPTGSSNVPARSSTKDSQRLADVVISHRDDSVQSIAERVIDELVDETPRDDIALVVKRIH